MESDVGGYAIVGGYADSLSAARQQRGTINEARPASPIEGLSQRVATAVKMLDNFVATANERLDKLTGECPTEPPDPRANAVLGFPFGGDLGVLDSAIVRLESLDLPFRQLSERISRLA